MTLKQIIYYLGTYEWKQEEDIHCDRGYIFARVVGIAFFFFAIIVVPVLVISQDVAESQNHRHSIPSTGLRELSASREEIQEEAYPDKRYVGYGELADGSKISLYVPVEKRKPTRSSESSRNYGYYRPRVAENDSYYGEISENTGRPKTVYVRGYYRKDGTYVRSHYRSPPR